MKPDLPGQAHASLKLRAEDGDDLSVIAACLQDALVRFGDMSYLPRHRLFAAVFNRFRWEAEDDTAPVRGERLHQRVRTGVHFHYVQDAKSRGLERARKDDVLSLLTIDAESGKDGAAVITLAFAGGADIRLAAECIDCQLTDVGPPWATRRVPEHGVDEESPSGG